MINRLLTLLQQFSPKQHYVVDAAADGQVGWEFAAAYDYDLILLMSSYQSWMALAFVGNYGEKSCPFSC